MTRSLFPTHFAIAPKVLHACDKKHKLGDMNEDIASIASARALGVHPLLMKFFERGDFVVVAFHWDVSICFQEGSRSSRGCCLFHPRTNRENCARHSFNPNLDLTYDMTWRL